MLQHLTPELIEAFRLSGAIGDTAARDFELAVGRIRGDARQGQSLRKFYAELPTEEYVVRQQAVHLIGQVGTAEDVPLLEGVALTPLSVAPETSSTDEHHEPTAVDHQVTLRNASVVALSRLASRGEQSALASLGRLLADADNDIALLAGVELTELGKLGAKERRTLKDRGITASFTKLKFEETFKLELGGLSNPRAKAPVEPPPAP